MVQCENQTISVSSKRKIREEAKIFTDNVCEDIVYRSLGIDIISSNIVGEKSLEDILSKRSEWVGTIKPVVTKFTSSQVNSGISGLILDGVQFSDDFDGLDFLCFESFLEHIEKSIKANKELVESVSKRFFSHISELYNSNRYTLVDVLSFNIDFVFEERSKEFEPYFLVQIIVERI